MIFLRHFEKALNSSVVYDGKIIRVLRDEIILENGAESVREVVRHKGAVAVLAADADGSIYLVRQFRYPVGRELLEVPAGKLEAGESPLECAKRELLEECGVVAESWAELGPIYTSPGFCDEVIWLFFAKELSPVGQHLDDDEFLDVVKMPFAEALKKAEAGAFTDGKTQLILLRCKNEMQPFCLNN